MRDVAFDVPCSGQWELVENHRGIALVPAHYLDRTPLAAAESKDFDREIGELREGWKAACKMHLQDLRRVYPKGLPR
jgi:hypothetical protein